MNRLMLNNQRMISEVKGFIGDFALGSTYLLMKSWRISSESLKSLAWWLLACLWTFPKVSLKSSCHHINFLKSLLIKKNTFVLEQILILLNQLLWSQPAILIKQINLKNLLLVLSVGWTEQSSNDEWEKVSESSESDVCCENVVIVWVKELNYGNEYQQWTNTERVLEISLTFNYREWHDIVPLCWVKKLLYDRMGREWMLLQALMGQDS